MVGDVRSEQGEAVAFGGLGWTDRRHRRIACGGDIARGHAGVDRGDRSRGGERGEEPTALLEDDGVALDSPNAGYGGTGNTEEPVIPAPENFAPRFQIVLADDV